MVFSVCLFAADHDIDDLAVGLLHALLAETAYVPQGVFDPLGHDAVAAAASTAVAILAAQDALAPSQMTPDTTASALTTVWMTASYPPPQR